MEEVVEEGVDVQVQLLQLGVDEVEDVLLHSMAEGLPDELAVLPLDVL